MLMLANCQALEQPVVNRDIRREILGPTASPKTAVAMMTHLLPNLWTILVTVASQQEYPGRRGD